MHIVKLGGSLFHHADLDHWLQAIQNAAIQQPILLVPGGGPFADQVRAAQRKFQFDDASAHHMALLAMSQFGLLLLARLPAARSYRYPKDVLPAQGLHIWLPDAALLQFRDIPQNWQVSADSLALWLAQRLSARRLSLIKSLPVPDQRLNQLSQHGLLDTAFAAFYQRQPLPCDWFSAEHYSNFPTGGSLLQ